MPLGLVPRERRRNGRREEKFNCGCIVRRSSEIDKVARSLYIGLKGGERKVEVQSPRIMNYGRQAALKLR